MTIEFPGTVIGDVVRIQVDGHHASLLRGENRDMVLKVAGRETVVPENPEAVVEAVRRLTGQAAA